jgi:hypothetical protein
MSAISSSGKKSVANRASRLEAEVNELTFQLRAAQRSNEDMQLEFEKLQVASRHSIAFIVGRNTESF